MGNNSGKKQCGDPCQKNLDELFNTISCRKSFIAKTDLKRTWSSQIDKELYANIESYLFLENPNELTSQTFKKLFLDVCKGDSEQKIGVLCHLLNGKNEIPGDRLLQSGSLLIHFVWKSILTCTMNLSIQDRHSKFIVSLLNSILIIQESKSPKKFSTWSSKGVNTSKESLALYAAYFLSQAQKTKDDVFTNEELRTVLIGVDFFLHMVLSRMYDTEDKHFYTNLLPKWRYGPVDSGRNLQEISILDLCRIIFLNIELPIDFQHEWRILFSTSVQGESFSKLSGEIINKGSTIIIVKDKDNHIFGGFAPSNWSLGPNFCGDSRSFLFTLYPKMNLYVATNFNDNYQYMNVGQQTMPNGLGMGGRLEYFGMWLNAEFGKGYCSESCTTYRNYKMMSGTKEFEIAHLEVWGVGPPPLTAAELGERSVLDGNLEAKAILEMAGKTAYSDGLREDVDN